MPSSNCFDRLFNLFNNKFAFIDSIKLGLDSVRNMILNAEAAPKFRLYMNNAYYVGYIDVIDLSWYAPYKTYGDLVFTGFAYIFFLLRAAKSIPNFIRGSFNSIDDMKGGN